MQAPGIRERGEKEREREEERERKSNRPPRAVQYLKGARANRFGTRENRVRQGWGRERTKKWYDNGASYKYKFVAGRDFILSSLLFFSFSILSKDRYTERRRKRITTHTSRRQKTDWKAREGGKSTCFGGGTVFRAAREQVERRVRRVGGSSKRVVGDPREEGILVSRDNRRRGANQPRIRKAASCCSRVVCVASRVYRVEISR